MTTAEIVTNFAGYQFAVLSDLKEQRKRLLNFCKNQNLKGTILLSEEGINMFIAGRLESIEKLISKVREIPGLENFEGGGRQLIVI